MDGFASLDFDMSPPGAAYQANPIPMSGPFMSSCRPSRVAPDPVVSSVPSQRHPANTPHCQANGTSPTASRR